MKKLMALLAAAGLLLSLGACGTQPEQTESTPQTTQETDDGIRTVGIVLPEEAGTWSSDGAAMAAHLQAQGIEVLLRYARNDAQLQAQQVLELVAAEVDCLVVTAVDSLALTDALQQAKAAAIPVIAYSRLPMNTDAVTCYTAYDAEAVGQAIAGYIVRQRQLETAQQENRSYTVEFFMGSPEDNNAVLLHRGALRVLQPYLDSGVLICGSGRVAFEDTCISGWSAQTAQQMCQRYITDYYAEIALDICVAASDSIAEGCRMALEGAGYTAENMPLLTGQGAQLTAVRNIAAGVQAMTVYMDTEPLVESCVLLVQKVLAGKDLGAPELCDNGTVQVPAQLYDAVTVDAENYRQILIDSGIYTEEELAAQ